MHALFKTRINILILCMVGISIKELAYILVIAIRMIPTLLKKDKSVQNANKWQCKTFCFYYCLRAGTVEWKLSI